jgi:hypothetical protein
MDASSKIGKQFGKLLQNPYIMAVLKISLVMYAAQIAPRHPTYMQKFFQNTYVKIVAIALIAYLIDIDIQLGVVLAIVFVLGTNFMAGRGFLESYETYTNEASFYSDMKKYTTLLGKPAAIGNALLLDSQSDNYSGCENVLLKDLLAIFDNNKLKMQQTVQYAFKELMQKLPAKSDAKLNLEKMARVAGLPYNIALNDYNAPLIATILINYGYVISSTCQAPKGDMMFASAPLPAYLAAAQKVQAASGNKTPAQQLKDQIAAAAALAQQKK